MYRRIIIAAIIATVLLTLGLYAATNNTPDTERKPAPSLQNPAPTQEKAVSPIQKAGGKFLRFIAMTDSRGNDKGINSKIIRKTLSSLKRLSPQPEFVIIPGDLCNGASKFSEVKAQLEYFKKIATEYYPANFYYPGIGNHEVRSNSNGEKAFGEVFKEFKADGFLDGYNRSVYYFDRGDTRLFMLNSDHPGEINKISNKQLSWLKSNTDKRKKYNIYALHEPPYPTGSHVGSSLDANRLQRDKLWQVIDSSANPMVFCGHEHNYTRRHIDSSFNEKVKGSDFKFFKTVYQLTVGSFGAPLYTEYTDKRNVDVQPMPQYQYAVIDISESGIKVTVYNVDGKKIDTFAQSRW